jgi:integrase
MQVIRLTKTKNKESRAIPLQHHAFDLVKEMSTVTHTDTDLLFPGKNPRTPVEIRKPWVNALKKANVPNFRFHDLRHSAASYLAMNGATLAEIAEVLGHKTLQMVKRYAHLSEQHTSRVVGAMNEKKRIVLKGKMIQQCGYTGKSDRGTTDQVLLVELWFF